MESRKNSTIEPIFRAGIEIQTIENRLVDSVGRGWEELREF